MSNDYTPPPITTPLGQVVNTKRAQQQRNFAMQPTQLNKSQQWLRDNPIPPAMGVVDELKSMLNPRNMTGANAIMDAFTTPGLSTTKRITTGLTGVAQGIGFALGGASGKPAVQGVANTGIPARIGNKIRGETVVVHGTGKPIEGNTLIPRAGSAYSPDVPAVFSWNTDYGAGKPGGQQWIHNNLPEYTNRSYYDSALGKEVPGKGNIVIGKTKKSDAIPSLSSDSVIATTKPVPITKVIQDDPGLTQLANLNRFVQELKKAGVKTGPGPIKNILNKAEAARLAKRNRNDISPV